MLLISTALIMMLAICFPAAGLYAVSCFIGFAIGDRWGVRASNRRRTSSPRSPTSVRDLMKIVFISRRTTRETRRDRGLPGDNAGDSVGPAPTVSRPTGSPASPSSPSSCCAPMPRFSAAAV